MLIKVFSDFCTSEQAITNYVNIWNSGNWVFSVDENSESFEFTTEDDYTHVILLNKAMPVLKAGIPRENVLGLSCEPLEFLKVNQQFTEYCIKNVGTYLIGKTAIPTKNTNGQIQLFELPRPFTCAFTYQWFDRERDNYLKIKNGEILIDEMYPKNPNVPISIWFSEKIYTPFHSYRKTLVERILKTNLPIDIYGRGCNNLKEKGDPRIKGSYNNEEPYKLYKYCITIENTESDYYISEKLMNCYSYNTIPIYLGARKAEEIFGENCCIRLTGKIDEDLAKIAKIEQICNSPDEKSVRVDLSTTRDELFEGKGNFLKFLVRHFTK